MAFRRIFLQASLGRLEKEQGRHCYSTSTRGRRGPRGQQSRGANEEYKQRQKEIFTQTQTHLREKLKSLTPGLKTVAPSALPPAYSALMDLKFGTTLPDVSSFVKTIQQLKLSGFHQQATDVVLKMIELGVPLTELVVTRALGGRHSMSPQDLKTLALILKDSIMSGKLQVSVMALTGVMEALVASEEKLAAVQVWKHCSPLLPSQFQTERLITVLRQLAVDLNDASLNEDVDKLVVERKPSRPESVAKVLAAYRLARFDDAFALVNQHSEELKKESPELVAKVTIQAALHNENMDLIEKVKAETEPEFFNAQLRKFVWLLASQEAPSPSRIAFLRQLVAAYPCVNTRSVLGRLFVSCLAVKLNDDAKSLLIDLLTASEAAGLPMNASHFFKARYAFGDSDPELPERIYKQIVGVAWEKSTISHMVSCLFYLLRQEYPYRSRSLGDISKPGRIPSFLRKLHQKITESLPSYQKYVVSHPFPYHNLLLSLVRTPYAIGSGVEWANLVDLLLTSFNVRLHQSLVRRFLLLFKLSGVLTPEMETDFEKRGLPIKLEAGGQPVVYVSHDTHAHFVATWKSLRGQLVERDSYTATQELRDKYRSQRLDQSHRSDTATDFRAFLQQLSEEEEVAVQNE